VVSFLLPSAERRAFRHLVKVECQVVRERDFKLVASRTLDVSAAGMLVAAKEHVLTGEPVVVSFRPPRSERWFDAQATVARVVHGRRPSDPGRALGLSFLDVEPATAAALRASLRRCPPTRSRRPQRIDWAATVRAIARS
jgi:c-di-GMP-binding flagellar brake protein YcgR